jgi:hypothetical protein
MERALEGPRAEAERVGRVGMRRPPRIPIAAIVVTGIFLAALSGCGGGTPSETGSGTTATGPRLGISVCRRLAPLVNREVAAAGQAAPLKLTSTGTVRLSTCTYVSRSARVAISLDTATNSHKRFSNRVVEEIQFSANDPTRRPHDVRGVGDPGSDNGGAVWTIASAQLLAIRGNRLLIVDFYVAGAPNRRLRTSAATLARRAYAVTKPAS